MTTLGWLGWRSIWVPPKGGEAATIPCIVTVCFGGLPSDGLMLRVMES